MSDMVFGPSKPLTIGIELELQILNRRDCDLTNGAVDLIRLLERRGHPGDVKPEITESMIEISTGIHERHATALHELRAMRDALVAAAEQLNLLVAGGGAHPFMRWSDRQIFDKQRFRQISALYGYLAKQFTIFGQHVHIGCPDGDTAMYLTHAMSRYIPHFIALAASSPFHQGSDTSFDSSRLNAVYAFPLSGRAPLLDRWDAFVAYFEKMRAARVVETMKDFYWDIRPKPEYGTIEIRVFDTPLSIERAAALAAWFLQEQPFAPVEDDYLVYTYNRFQACRFGLEAVYVDPASGTHLPLKEHILATLDRVQPYATTPGSAAALDLLRSSTERCQNDGHWLRDCQAREQLLAEVTRQAGQQFRRGRPHNP